jgi:kynureninase
VGETLRYCTNAIRSVCDRFGGDADALILCGFSRGAIACNYLGLHDDAVAPLWRAFIVHSHYDGVRTGWPYADAGRAPALARLRRLGARPQFISMENSTAETESYLAETGVDGRFTFQSLAFRNHTDEWTLRDVPERRRLRAWLADVMK